MFRSFSPIVNFILRRDTISHHRHRYINNLTSSKSGNQPTQSTTDNNEWLWEYLRHRQSYQTLNEEQKRQVILLE
jgi:hypothetical protein